jgi:hypothetical protein
MALETQIIEFPFTQGQDQGVQRDVLPLGQFSYLQNVRYRRNNRLGKRNGYTSLGRVDIAAATIGNADRYVVTLGEKFTAVDDRFYRYDEVGSAWGVPPIAVQLGSKVGGQLTNRWPQFMPAPTLTPVYQQSELDLYGVTGTDLPSLASMTYADGVIWTAWLYWRLISGAGGGAWVIRIVGTDPSSGKNVFQQDISPSSGGSATDDQHPHLLSTGDGTIVLVYDHFTAGTKDGIRIRLLTDRTAGFPATEYTVACLESAVNHYVGSADHILITYQDGTNNTRTGNWSVATQSFTTLTVTTTGGDGIPEQLSIYGISGGSTWIGSIGATSSEVKVRAYNSSLAVQGNSADLAAYFTGGASPPILFAARPATPTTVTAVAYSTTGGMCVTDVLSTGTITGNRMLHAAARPLSWPFNAGGFTYMWVRHEAEDQLGVATLVRIPLSSEYAGNVSPYLRSFPIEATLDDEDIDPPADIAQSGPTVTTPQSTPLGYVACLTPTVESFAVTGGTYLLKKPLLVPVRHRSEDSYQGQPCVVPVAGKSFVASAQPMFVDARGAVEAGFVQAPASATFVGASAGGSLSANAAYQYTCLFEHIDSNGRSELSAPCAPLAGATTANTTLTVQFGSLELSKKTVRANIYRTLADRTTFYFLTSVDASPIANGAAAGTNVFTIVDTAADTVVGANEQLYIQLGQELANSQFPACQFATEGGGRLWVGGGFKADVIQASKPIMPRLSVAFADDDAFRVTLPQACTGMAWLDNLVAFTEEGVYVVSGDGPDVAGVGSYSLTRLPFNIGCVNWRSVIATDEGVFFQSARGLCLLPRGFAEPVHMDQVMDTLGAYPYITSVKAIRSEQSASNTLAERTIQWTCVSTLAASSSTAGVVIVYDTVRKLWSVDTFGATSPCIFISCWDGQRCLAQGQATADTHQFRLQSTAYSDAGTAITRIERTGDLRPWGTFGHGVMNRVGVMHELASACTLTTTLTTEQGSQATDRVYTGSGADGATDATQYLEIAMGKDTHRDVNMLRIETTESSTAAGVALIHVVVETDIKPQGFKFLAARNRKV